MERPKPKGSSGSGQDKKGGGGGGGRGGKKMGVKVGESCGSDFPSFDIWAKVHLQKKGTKYEKKSTTHTSVTHKSTFCIRIVCRNPDFTGEHRQNALKSSGYKVIYA